MAHTGFSWDVGNRDWTLQSLGGDSGYPGLRWGAGKGVAGEGFQERRTLLSLRGRVSISNLGIF